MWPGRKPIVRKAHGICSSFGSTCRTLSKSCSEWGSVLELEPSPWVCLAVHDVIKYFHETTGTELRRCYSNFQFHPNAVSLVEGGSGFLSPSIHIQIPQTGLLYFSLENELKEFDKRSKHFLLGDLFITSHSVISWHCMDIVRRKWVTHWNTSSSSMDL